MIDEQAVSALLADFQSAHSNFQMDRFITARSGGDEWGCYHQALREIHKRWRNLQDHRDEMELAELDVSESEQSGILGKRHEIELRRLKRRVQHLRADIAETERELSHFVKQAEFLKAKIGDITPERRAELDAAHWCHKLRCMAALDYMANQRLSHATIEMLSSFPRELRKDMCERILPKNGNVDHLTEWFLAHDAQLRLPG